MPMGGGSAFQLPVLEQGDAASGERVHLVETMLQLFERWCEGAHAPWPSEPQPCISQVDLVPPHAGLPSPGVATNLTMGAAAKILTILMSITPEDVAYVICHCACMFKI